MNERKRVNMFIFPLQMLVHIIPNIHYLTPVILVMKILNGRQSRQIYLLRTIQWSFMYSLSSNNYVCVCDLTVNSHRCIWFTIYIKSSSPLPAYSANHTKQNVVMNHPLTIQLFLSFRSWYTKIIFSWQDKRCIIGFGGRLELGTDLWHIFKSATV
jgi:hypothetical protein